jgi:hypothetical protein
MFRFSHPETYGHAVLDILDEWVDGVAKGVPA